MTAGSASSPIMWFAFPSPSRYPMRTSVRSAAGPSGSSHHRTVSQDTMARPMSETVYTFSFTTDWFHTVKAVAPMIVATTPPVIRCQRSASHDTHTRSATRNHMPAAIALVSAASALIFTATLSEPSGRMENTRPISTNNGLPGGCGRPTTYAAAMYSDVSHMAVDGDSVTRYSTSTARAVIAAARYDGR